MNNKGFAISGILYTILIIFVVSISIMLFNLQNRKTILDELKTEAVEAVESDNNYEYLLDRINGLEYELGQVKQENEKSEQSSITSELDGYKGNIIFSKKGYNVLCTFDFGYGIRPSLSQITQIAVIPDEYRPFKDLIYTYVDSYGQTYFIRFYSSGSITLQPLYLKNDGGNSWFVNSFSWSTS